MLDFIRRLCDRGSFTVQSEEVPQEVQERYIHSGYRPVESGFRATLVSLWSSHNETINVWSHVLALVYFVACFRDAYAQHVVALIPEMHQLPLLVYFVGVCGLFLASSGAHLLNSISMTLRNVCFMVDYSAISVYGAFAAVYYFYYHHARSNDVIRENGGAFLLLVLLTSVFATWAACHTRLHHTSLCHVIRTSVYALPFILGNLPVFLRFSEHLHDNWSSFVTSTSLLRIVSLTSDVEQGVTSHLNTTQQINDTAQQQIFLENRFFQNYVRHVLYLSAAAAINILKVPERWFPGCFDIVAHSHQWFHLLIFLGIREQVHLVLYDISLQYGDANQHLHLLRDAPAMAYITAMYVTLIVTLCTILVTYGVAIHSKLNVQTKELKEK